MKLAPGNTNKRRAATYEIYLKLHSSRTFYHEKTVRAVMCELMYGEPEAWRVVGITSDALEVYKAAGHRRVSGIERAHLTDRNKMIRYIFERDQPLTYEALFDYWLNTDRSVIALKRQNRSDSLGTWIPFENNDAKFFPRLGIGFEYRPRIEGELTRQLAET
jgi:hypothetical protein